jgi:hypothetical protein
MEEIYSWRPRILDHPPHYDDPEERPVVGIKTDRKVAVRGPGGVVEFSSIRAAAIAYGLSSNKIGKKNLVRSLQARGLEVL